MSKASALASRPKRSDGSRLSASHLEDLKINSGISPKTIRARGYRTIKSASDLIDEGFSPAIAKKIVPGLLLPLFSPTGKMVRATFKPDTPRVDTRRKDKTVKYENPKGSRNVVDCNPIISKQVRDVTVDLWITEGQKKADAAVSRGLCCLALAGVDNWVYKPDKDEGSMPCPEWDEIALRGRTVYLVFDKDGSLKTGVQTARRKLTEYLIQRGAKIVLWVDLPAPDGEKVGLDDYFVGGGTEEELCGLAHEPSGEEKEKPTLGKTVMDFVLANYDLHVTRQGQAFATPKTGVRLPVEFGESGGRLTADVRTKIFDSQGKVISKSTVSDVMQMVHEKARSTEPVDLHIRCASRLDQIVIDLAEPGSTRCVVVTPEGWSVQPEPPPGVYFRRSGTTLALPPPQRARKRGAGWQALADILGWETGSREFMLTRGWIAAAPFSHLQRPLMFLIGAPGSAKTARGTAVISVWDPREGLGSSFGKNLEDDRVKANGSFLVGYDNLSTISEAQSDHISRMVTGDAPDKRQLYSDSELHSMYYRRTGVMTAVNAPLGLKADAHERLIAVELNRIREFKSEDQVMAGLRTSLSLITADALDDLVRVLRNLPALYEDEPSSNVRMKDYWLVQRALGKKYAKTFAKHSKEGMLEIALNDPWIQSVVAWIGSTKKGVFRGTPDEGFAAYSEFAFQQWSDHEALNRIPETRRPRDASALSRALASNAVPLEAAGVTFTARKTNGTRIWEFTCAQK